MKTRWKLVIIFAVIAASIWALYPSVRYYSMTSDERARLTSEERDKYIESALKLGLDLQGGVHIVLEVDDSKLDDNAKKDIMDRAIKIYRNRIDQFGVAEPTIQQQGDRRIIVELPGLEDVERAHRILGQTAQLEFRLVREQDEMARTLTLLDKTLRGVKVTGTVVDTTGVGADTTSTATTTPPAQAADAAVDSLLPTLAGESPDKMPMPEASPDRPFTSYLVSSFDGGVVVDERRVEQVTALLATEQARRAIPANSILMWGHQPLPMQDGGEGRVLYMVEKNPTLDGSSLVDATTRPDPDDPSRLNVGFRLNRQGAIIFGRFTGENIGRRIAIVLDSKVRSAPVVQSKIPGGEGRITGLDNDEEAGDLAIVLRAGALPAPVTIAEERTVGPSLGRDSVNASAMAAGLGFVLTLIFMMIYYRWSGALACAAMILNLVIELAILAKLRATITLPGVAGLILTIGMSVDANVLIFERMREELAKGKTVRAAIEAGYDRAFNAILDSNVTTLITAFVLWQFGTGPVKGFATTLSIGILVSMFTALVCTRVVFDLITSRRHVTSLSV
jgi:protein-export membrane protein SecD